MNFSREEEMKLAQKFYLKMRAIHEDLVYAQLLSDQLHLDASEIKIPLYEINLELQKYHDATKDRERDLDETQQNHFTKREGSMLKEKY